MEDKVQLPFDFEHRPSLSGDDFLVASSNEEAVAWIDKWPDWPTPVVILYGPTGCGKSHLSNVFIRLTGASKLTPSSVSDVVLASLTNVPKNFVIEISKINAFCSFNEEKLLHLYNNLVLYGGHMLITAESHPINWKIGLADLSSRIRATQAISIGMPDDNLIKAVLVKLFSDQQVRVEVGVIDYVIKRIERSFDSARKFVRLADKIALSQKKSINLNVARQVLNELEAKHS